MRGRHETVRYRRLPQSEARVPVSDGPRRDKEIRWRLTFVDAVTARRIDVVVNAPHVAAARERGWAVLRATRPAGLVVVDLVETRALDDTVDRVLPREDDDERDQGLHPPGRDQ